MPLLPHNMPCLGHMLGPAVRNFSERRKERVLSCNRFVVLCSSGLQSPKSASSEAKGIHLSQESVLLTVFHGLLHSMLTIITECLVDAELNSSERCARVRVCVCVCVCI